MADLLLSSYPSRKEPTHINLHSRMKMTKLSILAAAVLAPTAVAFAPSARTNTLAPALSQQTFEPARYVALNAEGDEEAVVDAPAPAAEVDDLAKAESLGRGAAKVRSISGQSFVLESSLHHFDQHQMFFIAIIIPIAHIQLCMPLCSPHQYS